MTDPSTENVAPSRAHPTILIEDPIREQYRVLNELPIATKLITERREENAAELRSDMLEPSWKLDTTESRLDTSAFVFTDTALVEPSLVIVNAPRHTDEVDPIRK